MPTALLAWELGGGAGHCVNLAPVAERLVARGWDVWVAARDVAVAEQVLRPIGVRYLQSPILLSKPTRAINPTRTFADILHNTGFGDDAQLQTLADAWANLMQMVRPDLVVCEHAPLALLASRDSRAKRVVLGTGFFSPPDHHPLPLLRYWEDNPAPPSPQVEDTVLGRVNRWLSQHTQPTLQRLSQLYADVDETFLLTFPELDHYPTRQGVDYFGMWTWKQHARPEWPDAEGRKLFAYLKQLPSSAHMAGLLSTLVECKQPSLVYVAGADLKWLHKFDAPHLRFVNEPVDMSYVAEQADFAVLNGNAGAATTLLLAGVPQLHLPIFLEQDVFARRVTDLGAALQAGPHRTEQVAMRLAELIHNAEHFQNKAREFAERYRGFQAAESVKTIVSCVAEVDCR